MRKMTKDRMSSIILIISSVELLRALKTVYPYSALSAKTGLSNPVLCRYVKGANLPSEGTALLLNQSLTELANLSLLLSRRLRQDAEGYVDSTVVSCDPVILNWAGREILGKYNSKHFTKILTAATEGIPLASAAALRLGIPLVIAKRQKEVGVRSFIEESYVSSSPASVTSLYVPKGAIAPGERILIVDNIIRSGRTINVLLNLAKKFKATTPNIYILIAIGDTWRKNISLPPGTQMDIVHKIPRNPQNLVERPLAA